MSAGRESPSGRRLKEKVVLGLPELRKALARGAMVLLRTRSWTLPVLATAVT